MPRIADNAKIKYPDFWFEASSCAWFTIYISHIHQITQIVMINSINIENAHMEGWFLKSVIHCTIVGFSQSWFCQKRIWAFWQEHLHFEKTDCTGFLYLLQGLFNGRFEIISNVIHPTSQLGWSSWIRYEDWNT